MAKHTGGTILVCTAPKFEICDGLIHVIGAETGLRFAINRHVLATVVAGAQIALAEINGKPTIHLACRMCEKREH